MWAFIVYCIQKIIMNFLHRCVNAHCFRNFSESFTITEHCWFFGILEDKQYAYKWAVFTFLFLLSGCWLKKTRECMFGSQCISTWGPNRPNFCCCHGDMCNTNMSTNVSLARESTYVQEQEHQGQWRVLVLVFLYSRGWSRTREPSQRLEWLHCFDWTSGKVLVESVCSN